MCGKCGCRNPWLGVGSDLRIPEEHVVTLEEACLIEKAIETAESTGIGYILASRDAFEKAGLPWRHEYAMHIFKIYVDPQAQRN